MSKNRLFTTLLLGFLIVSLPAMLMAGNNDNDALSIKGIGPRIGLGVDPDQFIFGGQAIMGPMFKIARLAPSIDVGFGDDVTVATFNADLQITLLKPPQSTVAFYGLVGPTLSYFDIKEGDSDTEVGVSIGGGIKMPMGTSNLYNLEARIGLGDIPDVKIMFGVYFGAAKKKIVSDSGN